MYRIRTFFFLLCLGLWTVLSGGIGIPAVLWSERGACAVQKIWAIGVIKLLRWIMNIRYDIRGRENLPQTPFLIASKHQSMWDTMIFLLEMPEPAFFFKKELLSVPVYGWYVRKTGMVAVDREGGAKAMRTMLKDASTRLAEGRSLIIFPEGTRGAPGETLPYQVGVAGIYRHLNIPVVPVALNSGLYWPKTGFTGKSGAIRLDFLEPIPPGLDRAEFMDRLSAAIEPATARLVAEASESPL